MARPATEVSLSRRQIQFPAPSPAHGAGKPPMNAAPGHGRCRQGDPVVYKAPIVSGPLVKLNPCFPPVSRIDLIFDVETRIASPPVGPDQFTREALVVPQSPLRIEVAHRQNPTVFNSSCLFARSPASVSAHVRLPSSWFSKIHISCPSTKDGKVRH